MPKLEDIELRSEEVQEILTKVPHWMIRRGNLLFLFLILLLLGISWMVKYPDVIPSEIIVTTQIPPQKEFAKVSGKLTHIFVKDNQNVSVDQPLAIIENSANHEDVFRLKSIIDTIRVNNESFHFPIDSIPILFLGDIETSFALFENDYIHYQLNREYRPLSYVADANQYSLAQLNRRLESLLSQKKINALELEFERKNLKRHQMLFEKGVISEQDYEEKQMTFAQAERNYVNFESSISQIREAIGMANKTSKGTQIDRIKEEKTLLKNTIQSFNQLKKSIKDWENLYVLKSNIKGAVTFLNYWSVNQTVDIDDLVFTVIPEDYSSFVGKLKSPAQNSGKIKLGQKVNINLENYPDTEFGVLEGKVENISLIPNDEGQYLINVNLPKELITSYGKRISFKHEMRGVAEIITEDLRLFERFFYQFREITSR